MELTKEDKKELREKITSCDVEDIISEIQKYKEYDLTSEILGRVFERLYVNEVGFSSEILIDNLVKIHPSFRTKNGSTWNRADVSYLGKKYILINKHANGKISSTKCDGPLKNEKAVKIRKDILDSIKKERCAILDIASNIECDHKDGIKDDWLVADPKTQKLEDFQPLCKTANIAKRDHCGRCKESGKRYDATRLGYSVSFLYGDENSKTCVGCYWFDPKEFNKVISASYKKDK